VMKIIAIALGVIAVAGTVVIAIAGSKQPHSNSMGAVALLACIVAVAVMILLGVTLGGRNNPRRMPYGHGAATGDAGEESAAEVADDQVGTEAATEPSERA
jgi:drug/metabolite transporter (DMT)-like permease